MQDVFDLGCQNYFGLDDIRYKKEDYNKILTSGDHTCLAPDLIQFDEFKSVLESEDFYLSIVTFMWGILKFLFFITVITQPHLR